MTAIAFVLSLAKTYLGVSPKLFAKGGAGGKRQDEGTGRMARACQTALCHHNIYLKKLK